MKTAFESLDVRFLERKNCTERWINASENCSQAAALVQNVLDYVQTNGLQPVSIRLFGNRNSVAQASAFLETRANEIVCRPILIVQDDSIKNVGIQVHALSAGKSKPLYFKDEFVGFQFDDDYAQYYMLRILPNENLITQYSQTQNVFEKAHKILNSFGSGFSDTVRTWLFADDILSWYGELNKARNLFFEHHDIYNKLVPASTGIGVANLHNKALAVQLLAIKPKSKSVLAQIVNSPLQCPALNYKSSFSRAVKFHTPDYNRLFISGTASIDKAGKTVFLNDVSAQLEFTMQVIKAILNEAKMDWQNAVNSMAYFKHSRDFQLFDDYCGKHGIKLPHIKVQADVCRDDLLFELELEAVSGGVAS